MELIPVSGDEMLIRMYTDLAGEEGFEEETAFHLAENVFLSSIRPGEDFVYEISDSQTLSLSGHLVNRVLFDQGFEIVSVEAVIELGKLHTGMDREWLENLLVHHARSEVDGLPRPNVLMHAPNGEKFFVNGDALFEWAGKR